MPPVDRLPSRLARLSRSGSVSGNACYGASVTSGRGLFWLSSGLVVCLVLGLAQPVLGWQEPSVAKAVGDESERLSSADLAERIKPSVVEISYLGREGQREGVGTGVIIDREGLVATNLHVIGEAREIQVKLHDGRQPRVTQVWASDPRLDLAVLRIEADGLQAVGLGAADSIRDGQEVVAIGNPHGLTYSVVDGLISGQRVIDGKELLQLAMPIEPGNSGGPLLNRQGELLGIVSLKSSVSDNLGFAISVHQLSQLLEKPNPITLERWLTIGALDEAQWLTLGGATWRRQGGNLQASGTGDGFGGRSLCLSLQPTPQLPFEIETVVRMDDEAGAAGLVFCSDGKDRHYGFYPSQGALRFSRFDGPTVFEWEVIEQAQSPFYLPGEWNRLKVRCEEDGRFTCSVNDRVVFEIQDRGLQVGKIGLAKFRQTQAEFRGLIVAAEIPSTLPTPQQTRDLLAWADTLPSWRELRDDDLQSLEDQQSLSRQVLRQRARLLEQQAEDLRRIAERIEMTETLAGLGGVIGQADEFDLGHAALWVARLDEPELNIEAYRERLAELKERLLESIGEVSGDADKLKGLNRFLFEENGFHGSRTDYEHPANSYLNRVLDDREGIPLTLSIVYLELGRSLGLSLEGVGLPGHFIVVWRPGVDAESLEEAVDEGEQDEEGDADETKRLSLDDGAVWIDVFERGNRLTAAEVRRMGIAAAGYWDDQFLAVQTDREMLSRLIANLRGSAERERDTDRLERYIEALLVVDPEDAGLIGMRAVLRFETGRRQSAIDELDRLLQRDDLPLDVRPIEQMRQRFQVVLDQEREAERLQLPGPASGDESKKLTDDESQ